MGKKEETSSAKISEPWLAKRTGLIVMTLVSLALAVLVFWQLSAGLGMLEAALWGLGFGASIWLVFGGMNFFNSRIRRR